MLRPATTQKFTEDDYKTGADNMRKVGEVAKEFRMTMMAEFVRTSTFISTLPTILKMMRAAAHPNIAPLFDCYHFWSGLNKLEDLDLIRPEKSGTCTSRTCPTCRARCWTSRPGSSRATASAPLNRILRKLAEKGYSGPLSVELFLPKFQQADPFELAQEIEGKGKP